MFNFDALRRSDKIAVHCPDRDIAVAFVREFKEKFPDRYFGGYPGPHEYWDRYGESTCYTPRVCSGKTITYCCLEYYEDEGYEIIHVNDLMVCDLGELAPTEVNIKCLFGME